MLPRTLRSNPVSLAPPTGQATADVFYGVVPTDQVKKDGSGRPARRRRVDRGLPYRRMDRGQRPGGGVASRAPASRAAPERIPSPIPAPYIGFAPVLAVESPASPHPRDCLAARPRRERSLRRGPHSESRYPEESGKARERVGVLGPKAQDRGFPHSTAPNSKALIKTTTSAGSLETRDREVVPRG